MRAIGWCSVVVCLQAATLFADARLTYLRTVAPAIDLGKTERIVVIYAIGDNDTIDTFVDRFAETASRSGALQVENAVETNRHLAPPGERAWRKIRREHPADAYAGVNAFTCSSTERGAEGSERDPTGERVKRVHVWIDAVCSARIEIRHPDGTVFVAFTTRGEGTSPRVSALSDEERTIAYEQAARYTAVNAAQMIMPRTVRESIDLDESAPQFAEGLSMIHSDRVADARAVWEGALRTHPGSAALHYDTGAVCEAMGDLAAARRHFDAAVRLAPHNRRYREELDRLAYTRRQ